MAKVSKRFVDETLWPEFEELSKTLRAHLDEIAERVIADVVHQDSSEAKEVPLLAEAIPLIGHFQIRNRGTVGGSIAHADPASELPAVALALDAELEIAGANAAATLPDDPWAEEGFNFLERQTSGIGGGTTEMARNVITERVLGMPRER